VLLGGHLSATHASRAHIENLDDVSLADAIALVQLDYLGIVLLRLGQIVELLEERR
jgi:hypothetical protein